MKENITAPLDELSEIEQEFIKNFSIEDLEEPTEEVAEEVKQVEEKVVEEEPVQEELPVEEGVIEEQPDYEALYKLEEQRRKTTEGRFKKAREDWKRQQEEMEVKKTQPVVSDNNEFWEEYDYLKKPISDLIVQLINEHMSPIKETVDSVKTSVATTAEETHFNTIAAAHPDFAKIAEGDEIKTWMNSLPYKTPGDNLDGEEAWTIFNTGSAVDVIRLFDAFKASRKEGEPIETKKIEKKVPAPVAASDNLVRQVRAVLDVGEGVPTIPVEQKDKSRSFEEEFLDFVKKG